MGQGGGVALTEEDKPGDVHHRTDVRPVKVDVGDAPGHFLEADEQSRDGIGNHGAPGVENATVAFAPAVDTKSFGKVGCISTLHFDKVDTGLVRKPVELTQINFGLLTVLAGRVSRIPGDEADCLMSAFGE